MSIQQNAHLTFKGNLGVSRHDWLRLTPAYSYRLVHNALRQVDRTSRVLDPFAGTATTGLVAAEMGMNSCLLDVNPFLVWFGHAKTRNYTIDDIAAARKAIALSPEIMNVHNGRTGKAPPIHRIERWWSPDALRTLAGLKAALDELYSSSPGDDLLAIAFCLVMIASSNAAFNHQSMSFKETVNPDQKRLFANGSASDEILKDFPKAADRILTSASTTLPGHVTVLLDDARLMARVATGSVDLLYTSPPYANRMSYIRELRPYMYWLGFLYNAKQAGEIDWKAIGGTWGVATSRVATWEPESRLPLGKDFSEVLWSISNSGAPNANVLARYVHKYFVDMFDHFQSARRVLKPGGQVTYIVGNSTFYGNVVPTERWYGELLSAAGFERISIEKIRKRNSKRELFEFQVSALRS